MGTYDYGGFNALKIEFRDNKDGAHNFKRYERSQSNITFGQPCLMKMNKRISIAGNQLLSSSPNARCSES